MKKSHNWERKERLWEEREEKKPEKREEKGSTNKANEWSCQNKQEERTEDQRFISKCLFDTSIIILKIKESEPSKSVFQIIYVCYHEMVWILLKQKFTIEINKKMLLFFMVEEEKSIILITTNEFIKLCKFWLKLHPNSHLDLTGAISINLKRFHLQSEYFRTFPLKII